MKATRGFFILGLLLILCQSLVADQTYNQDDFKAAKKAAEAGDQEAQLAVGIMYDLGEGVPQNFAEALNWYTKAANQGNAVAQNNLGVMYSQGKGTAQDYYAAAKWIEMSANNGYAKGQMNLGFMLSEGNGVPRNPIHAIYWLRKAAEQGDAAAEENLGNVYAKGNIVNWDFIEAYKWYLLAAAQGNAQAMQERDELAQKMTVDAINEAQQQAAAFVPTRPPTAVAVSTASGTGFFVTPTGYMLTANHVIDGASKIIVKTKFLALAAQVVKVDRTNDLALLKITGAFAPAALTNEALLRSPNPRLAAVSSNFRPLRVANSRDVKLGDPISTIGFPNPELQGNSPKFTRGEINSLTGVRDDLYHFQISAPIQPGNSGGPLLDRSGAVVGLVQSTLNDARLLLETGVVPQNVNYAIKSELLLQFLGALPGVNASAITPTGQQADWVSDTQGSIGLVLAF